MFSVTVRDHMMIAHSLRGEVFGPAQRLHGATYVVDATFRRATSTPTASWSTSAGRPRSCTPWWPSSPTATSTTSRRFAGMNTTTEALARLVADRLAERVHAGALGDAARELDGLAVTLHESHVAWASYERAL